MGSFECYFGNTKEGKTKREWDTDWILIGHKSSPSTKCAQKWVAWVSSQELSSIHLVIHPINEYLLNTYYGLDKMWKN